MQNSTNMRILELLRFLYERTDENHPATVSDCGGMVFIGPLIEKPE